MRKLVLTLGLIAASTAPASAIDYGEPKLGAALAQTWCASCHLTGTDDGQTVAAGVPTFAEVAKTLDDARRDQLALWLTKPHGAMPDLSLTQPEIADILAYIKSLAPEN